MTSIKFIFNKKSHHLNVGPSASELRHKAPKLGRINKGRMFLEIPVFFFQEDFQAITYGFKFATQVTETRAAGL